MAGRDVKAVEATAIPPRKRKSNYPEPFAARMEGREKRQLGDAFGLTSFGVNLTRLVPGGQSALLHRHSRSQEFVYVLEGAPTLVTEAGDQPLSPGMCVGFIPDGPAHHIVNHSITDALLLEIGDRVPGDAASYPADDLVAEWGEGESWRFSRKDGGSYG